MNPQESLLQYLVTEGYITPIQLNRAIQFQGKQGGELLQVLIQLSFLNQEKLRQAQNMHAQWLRRVAQANRGPHSSQNGSRSLYETGQFHPAQNPTGQHPITRHPGPPSGQFHAKQSTGVNRTGQHRNLHQTGQQRPVNRTAQHANFMPRPGGHLSTGERRIPPHNRPPHPAHARPHQPPQRRTPPPPQVTGSWGTMEEPVSSTSPINMSLSPDDMGVIDDFSASLELPLEPTPIPLLSTDPKAPSRPSVSAVESASLFSPEPVLLAEPQVVAIAPSSEELDEEPIIELKDPTSVPSLPQVDSVPLVMQTVAMNFEPQEFERHAAELKAAMLDVSKQDPMQTVAIGMVMEEPVDQEPLGILSLGNSKPAILPTSEFPPPLKPEGSDSQWLTSPSNDDIAMEVVAVIDESSHPHWVPPIREEAPPQPKEEYKPLESLQGVVLQDRFVVGQREAAGPGYVIYQAQDRETHALVNLRYMPFYAFIQQQQIDTFLSECQSLLALRHPNLIRLMGYGIHHHSGAYLIYQNLKGPTISTHLHQCTSLTLGELIPLFEVLCDSLEHLHRQGMVHRHLQLSSLQWPDASQKAFSTIQLLPTGLTPLATSPLTIPWMMALQSTEPLSLCPELGEHPEVPLTPAADVYALSRMLFELLTQKQLFVGDSMMHALQKHQDAMPPTLRDACPHIEYPEQLQLLLTQGLSKQTVQRPITPSSWFNKLVKAIQEAPHVSLPLGQITHTITGTDDLQLVQANKLLTHCSYDRPLPPMPQTIMYSALAKRLRYPRKESIELPIPVPDPIMTERQPSNKLALLHKDTTPTQAQSPTLLANKEPLSIRGRSLWVGILVFIVLLAISVVAMKAYAVPPADSTQLQPSTSTHPGERGVQP